MGKKDKTIGCIGEDRYDLVLEMIQGRKTAPEIGAALSVNQETVRKFARKRGLAIEKGYPAGSQHPAWKGGTTIDRSGYILRRVPKDGQYGYLIRAIPKRGRRGEDASGYAPEHRIVAHDIFGPIPRGAVVDHIDGDKKNNSAKNLRIFETNAEHLKVTLAGRVPNWTPEGRARMTGRRRKTPRPEKTQKSK